MELLQLQYFKTIAECQHITKAANKLMISQPSLSNTLSRIEAELGVQLFDRQGRNIVLNQYGKIVLEHAHNILRELDNIRTEIDAMQQRQEKVITIASTDSMYLREWLPAFIRANPDLTIRHTVSTIEKIETDILNGVIDFGISSSVSENPSFEHYTLWEDEYVILTPHPNSLSGEPVRNFADFAKMPFVALPAFDYKSRSIDILSNAIDITPKIIFEGERELLERVMLPLNASIVVLRALSQVIFAVVGAKIIESRNLMDTIDDSKVKSQLFSFSIALIHALGETLVVTVFFYGGLGLDNSQGFFYTVFLLVGVGTLVHSMVDFLLAHYIWKAQKSRLMDLKLRIV